ncbi:MAG: HD-GYP domain-containing protein, partial [Rhodospirillaceae bacterium]
YNLVIRRGTLTDEERFIINDHIIQTIIMLESLPLPAHLARVPEYAGGHHEKLNGTGYPRKLPGEALSVPARIMAIADVFEALTAADRPYKKAKTLSEAIKILGFMVKDHHIDPDLFKLFLSSGVYMEYAERFLLPEQIDEVDISKYLDA